MSFVFQLPMNNTDEEEPLQGERNQLPGLPASKIVVNTKTAKIKVSILEYISWSEKDYDTIFPSCLRCSSISVSSDGSESRSLLLTDDSTRKAKTNQTKPKENQSC